MKYILSKSEFITERLLQGKILFHGTLTKFDRFQDKMTFLSPSPQFAEDYASRKAFEGGADDDIITLTCKFTGNVFDSSIPEELEKLRKVLPEQIKVYGAFGFDRDVDRDELMLNLQAKFTNKVHPELDKFKVGTQHRYDGESIIIIGEDEDNVYYKNTRAFSDALSTLRFGSYAKSESMWGNPDEKLCKDSPLYGKYFEYLYEKFVEFSGNPENTSIKYAHHSVVVYFSYKGKDKMQELEKTSEFQKVLNDSMKETMKLFIEAKQCSVMNKKEEIVDSNNNWNFFENETVVDAIMGLGYDGYIAKEDGIPTYAIFHPNKSLTIIPD